MQNGEEEALAALFSLERERLLRMIKFRLDPRLNGRVDPEDLLQESFLAASNRLDHYLTLHKEKSVLYWLRLIVGQTMIDVHRRHLGAQIRDARRDRSFSEGTCPESSSLSLCDHLAGKISTPSGAAMRKELRQHLLETLEQLDPLDREVLSLRHFEELSNSEVAEVLGISQKAASMRYIRAIKRMKTVFSDLSFPLPLKGTS
ncbi:ECF RNA polymerase sigma factor SigW [Planctomycetales bacterium 10988]|nr:ECF RNA polymerase sigma factor SigW [Planctomycetales bacterium 10988]